MTESWANITETVLEKDNKRVIKWVLLQECEDTLIKKKISVINHVEEK